DIIEIVDAAAVVGRDVEILVGTASGDRDDAVAWHAGCGVPGDRIERDVVVAVGAGTGFVVRKLRVVDHCAALVREAAHHVAAVAAYAEQDVATVLRTPLWICLADADLGTVVVLAGDDVDH